MDVKKLAPWNWFKKEEENAGHALPVKRHYSSEEIENPIAQFHQDVDRLFDNVFRGFGLSSPLFDRTPGPGFSGGLLKPMLDLGATDKEYTVTVEIPGVEEKDVKLEICDNNLTIRGEKKHEKEEKDKNYYRMERSYGTFQRVLSLPEDADQDGIKATFKKGILIITMPRKALPKADVREIEIKSEK